MFAGVSDFLQQSQNSSAEQPSFGAFVGDMRLHTMQEKKNKD